MTRRSAYDWTVGLGGALIRIGGGLLVLMIVGVCGLLLVDFSFGMRVAIRRWAEGGGVDWVGFAALIGAVGSLVTIVAPIVIASSRDRRIRDVEATRAGVPAPPSPMPPSAPSSSEAPADSVPGGGLVNNEAIS